MRKTHLYLLLLLSGILLGIAFPPFPFGVLAFVGFLPLLIVLESASGIGQTFRWSYIAFWVFHGAANWWISSWQAETDPYLLASGLALWMAHPLFFTVPVMGYKWLHKRLGRTTALAAFPFLWVSFEWLHSLGEASYPWLTIGYTQILNTTYAQVADIGGVWLLSLLVAAVNVLIARLYFIHKEHHHFTVEKLWQWLWLSPVRQHVAGLALLLLLPLVYGWIQLGTWSHERMMNDPAVRTTRIAVVQPNINPWKKWDEGRSPHGQVLHAMALQDSLIAVAERPDLVVWSETAIPYRILAPINTTFFYEVQHWVDTSHIALLTGFPDDTLYMQPELAPPSSRMTVDEGDTMRYDSYNAAMILIPGAPVTVKPPVYKKMKLTPLAERLPYADALTFAMTWFEWGVGISAWGLGPEQHTLNYPLRSGDTVHVGSIICIESIYPDFVAGFVRKGANVLTVITNDGWYNYTTGPDQHFWIAAMRAIENRRYIARSANTGISGFITPTGETLRKSSIDTQLAMEETLPLIEYRTLYVSWGDWVPICTTMLAFFSLLSPLMSFRKK